MNVFKKSYVAKSVIVVAKNGFCSIFEWAFSFLIPYNNARLRVVIFW